MGRGLASKKAVQSLLSLFFKQTKAKNEGERTSLNLSAPSVKEWGTDTPRKIFFFCSFA
jgi:hypothetical protein